jgi:hypothetical protein
VVSSVLLLVSYSLLGETVHSRLGETVYSYPSMRLSALSLRGRTGVISAVIQSSKSRLADWPVTSQLNSVSRQRVAWRLQAKFPFVMATMKPWSCSWIIALAAVAVETCMARAACRAENPIRPLLVPTPQ